MTEKLEGEPSSFVPFDWESYLKDSPVAPDQCFYQTDEIPKNEFRIGQLLLAPDKHAANLLVLCKIRAIHKCWIYIHIEGLDDTHSSWVMCNERELKPVGPYDPQSKVDNRNAFPPTGLQPTFKRWIAQQYRNQQENIAPESLFKPISSAFRPKGNKFEVGMRLAAYDDKSFDGKLNPATVVGVEKSNVRINFDGWPSTFDIVVPYDARNIFPISFSNKAEIEVNVPKNIGCLPKHPLMQSGAKTLFPVKRARLDSSTASDARTATPLHPLSPYDSSDNSSNPSSPKAMNDELYDPRESASRIGRPGHKALAVNEQTSGVKGKVIGILKTAAEEMKKDVSSPPSLENIISRPESEATSASSIEVSKKRTGVVTNLGNGRPSTSKKSSSAKRRPHGSKVRILAPRLPESSGSEPRHVAVQPSTNSRPYKFIPVRPATIIDSRNMESGNDVVYAASGIVPVCKSVPPTFAKSGWQSSQQGNTRFVILGSNSVERKPEKMVRPTPCTDVPSSYLTPASKFGGPPQLDAVQGLPVSNASPNSGQLKSSEFLIGGTPRPARQEPTENALKCADTKEQRHCGAYIRLSCKTGPLLSRNKLTTVNFEPRNYVLLEQAIIQTLIDCAWVPKEVFDVIPGATKEPYLKVVVDDDGIIRCKKIPIFTSTLSTWMYLQDCMKAINCCPNLISYSEQPCDLCTSATIPPPPTEVDATGMPKNRTIKYKREIDVLRKLGVKLMTVQEVAEEYRKRLGDDAADIILQNEIDSSVLPYCQADVLREHMNIPPNLALKISAVACELRALAFESVSGVELMDLEL